MTDKRIGDHTINFLGKPYPYGPIGYSLQVGDTVIVHPAIRSDGSLSDAREPFEAKIVIRLVNWVGGAEEEICTYVEGKHAAVLNDYLFGRLQLKYRG